MDFLRFFSGLFICRPALPCFLPVLGGAGGGAGPLPPSSLSGGGGAEAAMDWGPESASAGDGGVLGPHHRPEGSQGQRSPPEQQQALATPRGKAQMGRRVAAPGLEQLPEPPDGSLPPPRHGRE